MITQKRSFNCNHNYMKISNLIKFSSVTKCSLIDPNLIVITVILYEYQDGRKATF